MKYKVVMFDVDGTIVDSFQQNLQAVQIFLQENNGPDITADDYREMMMGNAWKNIYEAAGLEPVHEIEPDTFKQFYAGYETSPLFDDIKSLLVELADKVTLVINTSTPIQYIMPVFEREEIDLLFSAYLGPEASVQKDEKITMVLEEMNLEPKDIIFIGDTGGDISEGKQANVTTVGVNWGYNTPDQIQKASPDHIVNDVNELRDLLLN